MNIGFRRNKFSCCDHAEQLSILEQQISSLQKSLANLRKDIPNTILEMIIEAGGAEYVKARYRYAGICKCGHHSSLHYFNHGYFRDCKTCGDCDGFTNNGYEYENEI